MSHLVGNPKDRFFCGDVAQIIKLMHVVLFFFLGGGGGGVEALRPSQQFFSHVGTEPQLPGYYQYNLGGKCI